MKKLKKKNNKHCVTFTFETENVLEDFLAWFCDGGGEQGFVRDGPPWPNFDYSRCFPAWGWKEGTPRFVDCEFDPENYIEDEDEIAEALNELDVPLDKEDD